MEVFSLLRIVLGRIRGVGYQLDVQKFQGVRGSDFVPQVVNVRTADFITYADSLYEGLKGISSALCVVGET